MPIFRFVNHDDLVTTVPLPVLFANVAHIHNESEDEDSFLVRLTSANNYYVSRQPPKEELPSESSGTRLADHSGYVDSITALMQKDPP